MVHRINQHEQEPGVRAVLSDAQFARLEELLLPGYELAKHYLTALTQIPDAPPSPEPTIEAQDSAELPQD